MKKLYIIALLHFLISISILLPQQASAQTPEKMSYQAVIRDSSNDLVVSTNVGMKISILQGSINGTAVYVETQTPTSNANGLVSVEIGTGSIISGDFTTVDWANGPYFIKTETDPDGGSNYSITGTSQLMSVPYALYAKSSGSSIPGPEGPAGSDGNGIASTVDNGDGTFTLVYDDGSTFTTADLTGPQGPAGVDGADGVGITSTTDNNDGTFTLNFDDGSTFTTADLTGPQGATGAQGPAGADGQDGVGITSTTDNNDGTFTLNFDDGSTFTTVDLTGPQGATGATGPAGADGQDGQDGVGITSTIDNNDGTFTLNFDDGSTFTTADLTGPQGATGPQGPMGNPGNDGQDGQDGEDGVGITSTTDNNDGTFTLNFTDGSSFTTADLTGPQGTTGPQGAAGADGQDGQDGVGITSTTDNNDGTFTLNFDDGSTFTTIDLTGPQGATGVQGPAGQDGQDGEDGVGITSTTDNNDGTFTLNFSDGSTFTTADLTGPQGATGPQGPAGADGQDGEDGVGITSTTDNNDGTFTLNFDDGSSFTTADLTGPQGSTGAQGPAGADGEDGVGITSTTDNNDGTFTLNFSDGSTFTTADLTGPQGATGPQGPMGNPGNDGQDGADGQDGVGITSTTDNNDGTFTLNFSDGSTFTTSDLTGEQGPTGPAGPTGPQGSMGNPGNDGQDGADGEDGVGITSTTDNNDGTFTLNFSDSSSFTTTDLTGPQGEQGNGIESTTDNGDGTFTFDYTDGTSFTTSDLTGPQGADGSSSVNSGQVTVTNQSNIDSLDLDNGSLVFNETTQKLLLYSETGTSGPTKQMFTSVNNNGYSNDDDKKFYISFKVSQKIKINISGTSYNIPTSGNTILRFYVDEDDNISNGLGSQIASVTQYSNSTNNLILHPGSTYYIRFENPANFVPVEVGFAGGFTWNQNLFLNLQAFENSSNGIQQSSYLPYFGSGLPPSDNIEYKVIDNSPVFIPVGN